jgi:UDP-perosamine 4-acetyltransferase
MSKPVILLGSGGHARVLLGMLRRLQVEVLGVVDPGRAMGSDWLGCRVLGDDGAVAGYGVEQIELVNGIGSIPKDAGNRARLFTQFSSLGYRFASVIDPLAFLTNDVDLAAGVQVMAGVIIQAGTIIAENSVVNSGAIVEHDCRVGRHVHIAPGATLCGEVQLADEVHIGAGAVLIQGIHIGSSSIIGAGSIVTRNVDSRQIVYPARSQIQDL